MRKLAPMFITTAVVAFATGTAFANTNDTGMTTDKMGSPTVSKNDKNPQGNSYSDKSNIAKGTNAKIDDPAKQSAGVSTATGARLAMDNDKERTSNDSMNTKDTAQGTTTPKAKKHRKNVASNAGKTSINPPVSETNAAAVKSTTGISGGDGGSAGAAGAGAGSAGSAGAGAGAGSSK